MNKPASKPHVCVALHWLVCLISAAPVIAADGAADKAPARDGFAVALADARQSALKWQADAVMVRASASVDAGGTIRVGDRMLAGNLPAMFQFVSRSAAQMFTVSLDTAGRTSTFAQSWPATAPASALPDDFKSLSAAIAEVLRAEPAAKGPYAAVLGTAPAGATWTLTDYSTNRTFTVNADQRAIATKAKSNFDLPSTPEPPPTLADDRDRRRIDNRDYQEGLKNLNEGQFSSAYAPFVYALDRPGFARDAIIHEMAGVALLGGRPAEGYKLTYPVIAGRGARGPTSWHVREEAPKYLKRAIELDPTLARAHSQLGVYYACTGDADGALREFDVAERLGANDPLIHIERARVLWDTFGRYADAAAEYGKALEKGKWGDEFTLLVHLRRATCLGIAGDTAAYKDELKWLIAHGHETAGVERIVSARQRAIKEASELHDPVVAAAEANRFLRQRDYVRAEALCRRALALTDPRHPNWIRYANGLGAAVMEPYEQLPEVAMYWSGRALKAAEVAGVSPRSAEKDVRQLAEAHRLRGDGLRLVGAVYPGKAELEIAVQLDPKSAAAHASLGRWHSWYCSMPQNSAAGLSHLAQAIALDPQNPDYWMDRGEMLVGAGGDGRNHGGDIYVSGGEGRMNADYTYNQAHERALADFEQARKLDPGSTRALLGCCKVYIMCDRRDQFAVAFKALAEANSEQWADNKRELERWKKKVVTYYRTRDAVFAAFWASLPTPASDGYHVPRQENSNERWRGEGPYWTNPNNGQRYKVIDK